MDTQQKTGLDGAHVVVIGGTSGIGRAVVADVIRAGGVVTAGSRSQDRLAAVAAEHGDSVQTAPVDITDEAAVRAFFEPIEAADHLVVCPGDIANGSVLDAPLDQVRRSLDTKIVGQYLCVRYGAPKLADTGSVVLLAGAAGFKGYAGMSATGAANAGIGGLGRGLALELAPLRVNVVVAGLVDTPLWDFLPDADRAAMYEQVAGLTPVGRIGRPEDISATVLHALTNTFLSGAVLHVDGGALA